MMSHDEKIQWMALWCAKHGVALQLEGECGFGRECVGISTGDAYPDYEWDDDDYNRIDENGEVWTPEDAYHKHPCVAVLGRGEQAEAQLFDWLKWFDDNGFTVEKGFVENPPSDPISLAMGKHKYSRMVRKQSDAA